MKKWVQVTLYVTLGLFIGAINGFLGAGGGMLLVPAYTFISKNKSKIAHATAIFIIMPICIVSGIMYIVKGVFSWTVFVPVCVGSLIGSLIGTCLMKKLTNDIISIIFWVIMIVSGILMIIF